MVTPSPDCEHLRELHHEAPSVAALATACGFSERYFAKLFREQTKQSIGQYLRTAQIAKAQSYLPTPNCH